MAEVIKIRPDTWRVEDGHVRFFLLTGTKKALLVDTGMTTPNARAIAESITDLPLELLNTHADPDHISGNDAFAQFYMHPKEWGNFHDIHQKDGTMLPVQDGDTLDLGDRVLEVVELPGHTPGSIALLDVKNRILFGGDVIQDGRIFMFGGHRNLDHYIESLSALYQNHYDRFDTVYPSHGTIPLEKCYVPKLLEGAKEIRSGAKTGHKVPLFGREVTVMDFGFASFLCE